MTEENQGARINKTAIMLPTNVTPAIAATAIATR
jgi:hypothetical protein